MPASLDPDPVFHYLEKQGFLWLPGGKEYVPGIPSLMDFVLQQPATAPEEPRNPAPGNKMRQN